MRSCLTWPRDECVGPASPDPPGHGVAWARDDDGVDRRPEEDVMESVSLLDRAGRRRSPATLSTHRGNHYEQISRPHPAPPMRSRTR